MILKIRNYHVIILLIYILTLNYYSYHCHMKYVTFENKFNLHIYPNNTNLFNKNPEINTFLRL